MKRAERVPCARSESREAGLFSLSVRAALNKHETCLLCARVASVPKPANNKGTSKNQVGIIALLFA